MGQRLNLEIIQNGKVQANAYYHWSAYTSSALELAETVLANLERITHEDPVLRAVRLLESTDARLTEEEFQLVHMEYPDETFTLANSRNDGLIAISDKGIDETKQIAEGCVSIDLDDETVHCDVYWYYDGDDYMEEQELSKEAFLEIPNSTSDFNDIPFSAFAGTFAEIKYRMSDGSSALRMTDGSVLSFIE